MKFSVFVSALAVLATASAAYTNTSSPTTTPTGPVAPWCTGWNAGGFPVWEVFVPTSVGPWSYFEIVSIGEHPNYHFAPSENAFFKDGKDIGNSQITDESTSAEIDLVCNIPSADFDVFSNKATGSVDDPTSEYFTASFEISVYDSSSKVKRAVDTYYVSYTVYIPYNGTETTSAASTVLTVTDTAESTTTATITSCKDNKCSETAVPTGVTVVTTTSEDIVTVYTTYCPLTATSKATYTQAAGSTVTVTVEPTSVASEVTTTIEGITTVYTTFCPLSASTYESVVTPPADTYLPTTVTVTEYAEVTTATITSCKDNKCAETAVPTGVTVLTTTSEDVVTVYTTYCPLSTEKVLTTSVGYNAVTSTVTEATTATEGVSFVNSRGATEAATSTAAASTEAATGATGATSATGATEAATSATAATGATAASVASGSTTLATVSGSSSSVAAGSGSASTTASVSLLEGGANKQAISGALLGGVAFVAALLV